MTGQIRRRDDVNPERGIHEYGDVEFADPVNNKYPIDTDEHILTGWRYIHKEHNEQEYSDDEVKTIEKRMMDAARKHGLRVTKDDEGYHIAES